MKTSKRAAQVKKHIQIKWFLIAGLIMALIASGIIGFSDRVGNNYKSVVSTFASSELPTDLNDDNVVDIVDLSTLLSSWGTASTTASKININPSNGSYVDSARPDTIIYNTEPNILKTDKDPSQMDALLRFKVPDTLDGPITQAILKMKVVDNGSQYSSGDVYATSNDKKDGSARWYSDNLTWNNAPPAEGTVLFQQGPTVSGQIAEFDLTGYYANAGDLKSIRVVGSNAAGVHYSSKTGEYSPNLELSIGGATSVSDINKDGIVDIVDLSLLLSDWGKTHTPDPDPDPTPDPDPSPVKPDASNTGVPEGTTLSTVTDKYPSLNGSAYTINGYGRVTINGSGTASDYLVFDGVYFPHGVVVKGNYIKIVNSKIAAGRSSYGIKANPVNESQCSAYSGSGWALFISRNIPELTNNPQEALIVEDTEIYIRHNETLTGNATTDSTVTDVVNGTTYTYTNDGPSIGMNAFQGRNATFRRVNVHGGVDSMGFNPIDKAAGETKGGVVLEDSYLHSQFKWPWPAFGHGCRNSNGGSRYTHSDSIQLHGDGFHTIKGNTINGNPIPLEFEFVEGTYGSSQPDDSYDKNILSSRLVNGDKYVTWRTLNNTGIQFKSGGLQKVDIIDNHFQWGTCAVNTGTNSSAIDSSSTFFRNTFYGNHGPYADKYGSKYPPYSSTNKRSSGACAITEVYWNGYPVEDSDPNANRWSDGSVALPVWGTIPGVDGY